MNEEKSCPVCAGNTARTSYAWWRGGTATYVHCFNCGKYLIEFPVERDLDILGIPRHLISYETRRVSDNGDPLVLTREVLERWKDKPPRELKVPEQLDIILRWLGDIVKYPGERATMPDFPFALAQLRNKSNFDYLIEHLISAGLVEKAGDAFALTVEGWKKLEALNSPGVEGRQVFVAMYFSDDLKPIYEGAIKPAIEECGFNPVRIDEVPFNEDVVDRMITEIRRSAFVVADCTGQRNGVYFEAGYAKGFGLPVIWTCRKDEMEKAHFDTNHFNHIVWEDAKDLKDNLTYRIKSTIRQAAKEIAP